MKFVIISIEAHEFNLKVNNRVFFLCDLFWVGVCGEYYPHFFKHL